MKRLERKVEGLKLDLLMLQYTPHMYRETGDAWSSILLAFWKRAGIGVKTGLIVHESYFRSIRHLPSLVRGTLEKRILRNLVKNSNRAFAASSGLVKEFAVWGLGHRASLLPIGSNFPVRAADRFELRSKYKITSDALVLTLFGGGNNLVWARRHIECMEEHLGKTGTPYILLLLGGVPHARLKLVGRCITPGYLSEAEISAHLQITDCFLMPNWSGLNARRGTLMAALEHGNPVIGTRGPTTEDFWRDLPGVLLASFEDESKFADYVLQLASDPVLRRVLGDANKNAFPARFGWPVIAEKLLEGFSS